MEKKIMKILAVIGSPKGKGSGYKIVKMIEKRMKAIGDLEFTYLFLKEANLKPCTGCYTCIAKGEDKCPLKDDRSWIEQKLMEANGVILSSPMHVLNVSWLMDNFMARFAYTNHRPCFHHLKVLTVVNMGGDSPKTALALLRKALGGSRVVQELGIPTPPWLQTDRVIEKKERAIDIAAEKFYRACLDASLPTPALSDLILFLLRQKVYLSCRQALPADYAYYNKRAYYYDTNISPIKMAVAQAMAGIMAKLLRDMRPGNIPWPMVKDED